MPNNSKHLNDAERKQKEDERYLAGKPNRTEVANYVNALMEKHYIPSIMNNFSSTHQAMQLGFMVIQAILIQKGVCTTEEISEMTQEFVKIQQKENGDSSESNSEK